MGQGRAWMAGGLAVAALAAAILAAAGGCVPTVPRAKIVFANLAGIYYAPAAPAAPADNAAGAPAAATPVEGAVPELSEALLVRAVKELNATKDLDFVVLSGDLFARADGLSLDRMKGILAELRVPYYVVLGDHDMPADKAGLSRALLALALEGHGFDSARGYWSREVLPGLVLVGLDTAQAGQPGGHVDPEQLAWLDQTLTARADKAVIVLAHHGLMPLHPLDEGSAWRDLLVDNAEAVREVIERHPNVVLVLTGHHHFAEGRVSGQTVYAASPSVSVWPLAYHLVRLSPQEVEAVWVPLGADAETRRAQDRLLGSKAYRGVFAAGEDGDTACVRLFGGNKMQVFRLPGVRQ